MTGPSLPPSPGVPAPIVAAFRAELPRIIDEMIDVIADEVTEYARPLDGEFGRQIRSGVTVALETFMTSLTGGATPLDLSLYEALGRSEMLQGRTLDALQSAYRVGARVAWRNVAEAGTAAQVEPPVLFRLAELIFAYIDLLAAASVKGYTGEQAARAGATEARRHALVEMLTRRPAPPAEEVDRVAAQADWPTPVTVAAVAVGADATALGRRLPTGSLGAELDPVGVILVPDPDGPGRPARVAEILTRIPSVLGPTVEWSRAAVSVQRATAAWALHEKGLLSSAPHVRAADHRVALLLAADPPLAREISADRLAPLTGMTAAAQERTVATLRAWLDAHGDVTETARTLHVHAQTVRYRLGALPEAFAAALTDAGARLELDLALRARELAGPQP